MLLSQPELLTRAQNKRTPRPNNRKSLRNCWGHQLPNNPPLHLCVDSCVSVWGWMPRKGYHFCNERDIFKPCLQKRLQSWPPQSTTDFLVRFSHIATRKSPLLMRTRCWMKGFWSLLTFSNGTQGFFFGFFLPIDLIMSWRGGRVHTVGP